VSRTQYQYSLEDADAEELAQWVPKVAGRMNQLSMLRDVASDQQNLGLEARLVIDRGTASRLGISPQLLDDTLDDAFGQRQVSTIFTEVNQYHVILETTPELEQGPEDLARYYYVRSAAGGEVPLSAITHLTTGVTPLAINHQGQFPVATISFNLAPGASLGQAVDAIHGVERELGLPSEHSSRLSGHGARLSGVTRQRAAAHSGGDHHRLPRARHPLRELHPSDHDPLDAAVSRRRCAARADDLPHRVQRHRAHRRDSPHRDRREERDHDDRLRARRRAARASPPPGTRSCRRPSCAFGPS